MEVAALVERNWRFLADLFPADWEALANETGAVRRLRGFRSSAALLRTLLLHIARGYSLRETVVRARAGGLAQVSDVALLKRLRRSEEWLRRLCLKMLDDSGIGWSATQGKRRIRLVDSTLVKEPGPTGSQWRLHYSLRIPDLHCDAFSLTPTEGKGHGDSFKRFAVYSGELVIGDRGYSHTAGVVELAQAGAAVLVRVNPRTLPLQTPAGASFPLLERLRSLRRPGQAREWDVLVGDARGTVAGRVCVIRKSGAQARCSQRKLRRKAQKKGIRYHRTVYERAKYVMVFTTLPRPEKSTADVLELYRLRWQIELQFKRLKSLAQYGHLPKHDEKSARAWLYGKLFVALLASKLTRLGRDFSPWGYHPLSKAPQPVA